LDNFRFKQVPTCGVFQKDFSIAAPPKFARSGAISALDGLRTMKVTSSAGSVLRTLLTAGPVLYRFRFRLVPPSGGSALQRVCSVAAPPKFYPSGAVSALAGSALRTLLRVGPAMYRFSCRQILSYGSFVLCGFSFESTAEGFPCPVPISLQPFSTLLRFTLYGIHLKHVPLKPGAVVDTFRFKRVPLYGGSVFFLRFSSVAAPPNFGSIVAISAVDGFRLMWVQP
jgi:hypothetical protein